MRESWTCERASADTAAARLDADTNRFMGTPSISIAILRAVKGGVMERLKSLPAILETMGVCNDVMQTFCRACRNELPCEL